MPQSTKALMALFLFSFLILTQQRVAVQAETAAVHNTVDLIANGVATERLAQVSALGFDQATVDNISVSSASALTAPSAFGPKLDKAGDDIDDFDGTVVSVNRGMGADTLHFRSETSVYYVEDDDPHAGLQSASPTKHKKIDVKVYCLDVADADTVRLSMVKACKSSCPW